MFENLALRGLLSVIGAFMVSLGVGFMYLWGIITIYATSYFRIVSDNSQITEALTDLTFPLIFLGQAISMPLAARFAKKSSTRFNCVIAGIILWALLYMSSYCQTYPTFAGLFGLCCGTVLGVIYILPIAHCHKYFPTKKASISAIVISASGIGTMIFAYVGFQVINPKNISVRLNDGYYGRDVADQFPKYLRILAGFMLAFVSGGGLLLFEYPQGLNLNIPIAKQKNVTKSDKEILSKLMEVEFQIPEEDNREQQHKNPFGNMNYQMSIINKGYQAGKIYGERQDLQLWESVNDSQSDKNQVTFQTKEQQKPIQQNKDKMDVNECPRVRDSVKQRIFWVIFLCLSCGTNFGLLISGNYKTFAKNIIDNDAYLTMVGSLGAVACGFSRFFWGYLLDKFQFKVLYSLLLIINAFLAFTIIYAVHIKQIYFLYVILTYIIYGGHLGMFPAITTQVFGVRYGNQIYGIMFYGFTVSNFIQFALINRVQSFYGLFFIFTLSGGMSIASLLISNRTDYKYDWSIRIREENERKRVMTR